MVRKPAVAGRFYEKDAAKLRDHLQKIWPRQALKAEACIGAVVPHAGYVYSGKTAARVYSRMAPADTYILLGPNHTGRGRAVALASDASWETPLGRVPIEKEIAKKILSLCPHAGVDDSAHAHEHSLEVQLPFLQFQGKEFSIVPLVLGTWDLSVLQSVGETLAEVVRAAASTSSAVAAKIILLASSDMNHFENLAETKRRDQIALARVLAMDPAGLLRTVSENDISMCGAGPVAALLFAAQKLGAREIEQVAYATSAEASGDEDRVVGYAGMIIK